MIKCYIRTANEDGTDIKITSQVWVEDSKEAWLEAERVVALRTDRVLVSVETEEWAEVDMAKYEVPTQHGLRARFGL